MDFSWSDEQLAYKQDLINFARANLNTDPVAHDEKGTFSREGWQACAEYGILGMAVPEVYSGTPPVDFMSGLLAMEGLGYGCLDNGLPFALNAQMWTIQLPIQQFGTDEQKAHFLPKMCDGTWIGAHAITEPEVGSDAFNMKMEARKTDGGYVLNGTKRYITLGPVADVAMVFATIDPSLGKWGVTAFLVERGTPGFTASPVRMKMGLRTVPIGELFFEDCFVPESRRLGPDGAGFSISHHSLEYERCSILASQLGAMERQLEQAVDYASTREQFGQPIGKFQSVSNRIADMKLRLETARLLLYHTAWLKDNDQPAMMASALLKLHLSESFVDSSLDAIRIHGGHGYMTENGIERDLRDAIGGTLYAGTSDIQRNIIARLLGL